MYRKWLRILSVALIYCGTVFGAGFASGQEIFRFFSAYGTAGILSSFLIGLLFVLFGCFLCYYAKRYQIVDVKTFFRHTFSPKIAELMNFFCAAFLILSFCIMIVGCATLTQEQFHVSTAVGAIVALALCFLVIRSRVQGLAIFNGVVTPFLFLGVTVLCIVIWRKDMGGVVVFPTDVTGGIVRGLLYLSYNMLPAAAVLIPAAHLSETAREAGIGGGIGGALIGIPLVLMTVVLSRFPDAELVQMPFFSLICTCYEKGAPFCSIVLYGAMLTTATSSGVSVLSHAPEQYTKMGAALLCLVALAFSLIPFRTLVESIYTAFGFCGILFILGACKLIFRKNKDGTENERKKE